jgi:dienelactone hydrolase
MIADKQIKGMPEKQGVSENSLISFSKTSKHLFFGTAPILPVKDTTLPDFERVSVDVWHYNDDYLQPMQLRNLDAELRKSFTARYDFEKKEMVSLANSAYRNLILTNEADGSVAYAIADGGKRVAMQWQGFTLNDLYAVDPFNGATNLIQKDFKGNAYPSYTGKYLLQYDERKKQFSAYDADKKSSIRIAKDINLPLYDVDNDVPDDPNAYGIMGWLENDAAVFIYDKYDIWQVDPAGTKPSICITGGLGRKNKITYRNIVLDREEKFIKPGQQFLYSAFNEITKGSGLQWHTLGTSLVPSATYPAKLSAAIKAKDAAVLSFGVETYTHSSDIRVVPATAAQFADAKNLPGNSLFQPNAQQSNYNWGTAELFKWKAYTGKETEGIVYKPEDFDPNKKYPMIVYFYERNSDGLYSYQAPAPTPSRLNIPFFVSRGYIVFVPDIWYKTGYPGQGAYDHILSGTRAVVKQGYVDSTKIGLQGQSWGGYQIVYLITKTNLYAAAWAGAPVANMTSAYGGIRWGTGLNRQFQYEKTQSRIGATLWEKPNLYLENSALFSLPKVKTPLVVMANDADDAVPWYQGIEMFTGLRRLGKPVWMLNYNNEAHNLVERKNRKDIQIREQQFFDYLLKGEKPAKWIAEGVPAIMKGRDWGLGY